MKKIIPVVLAVFFLQGCVPALIGASAYHSSKTKGQRQQFMKEFQDTNIAREKQGLPPLDWCSEAYHFDHKYAKTDKNCAARIKAYEAGDQDALSDATIVADPNNPGDQRKQSRYNKK